MAPLILESETLGQKHRQYNNLLKKYLSNNTLEEIQKINYDEQDLQNLLRIDAASYKKNVDYILEVLKSEDMLYVSRAIKQSNWLITDNGYAHIINPDYIHSKLLPQMTSKAGHKLLLNIRLNLKDEKRVEEFYKHYSDKNELQIALKWLQNCSIAFIENVVSKHAKEIPFHLTIRLCEKSFTVFEIYTRERKDDYILPFINKAIFLLNNDPVKYLNSLNTLESYELPKFNRKSTNIIMKSCPDMILNNFEKFAFKIDIPTFTNFLKKDDIKDFLRVHIKNRKLKKFFTFDNLRHFLARMPSEGRFEYIKQVYIEKSVNANREELTINDERLYDEPSCALVPDIAEPSNANIYRWYTFAPFSVAFTDLRKLIRSESNPRERNAMFAILLTCARRNSQNVHTLLQYYHDKHINEPFKHKNHFINIVLSQSYSHEFDDNTWSILNDIFHSMEVFIESENNVQTCLKHIILYNVVHNNSVPEIIENKFEFDTMKNFQSKLNQENKDKVFKYLYQLMFTKLQNIVATSESDFKEVKKYITNILNLFLDWKKDLKKYSAILDKIKELIEFKVNKCWNEDFTDIYNINKSWRKHMFTESLFMHPKSETFVNALKHGPQVLIKYEESLITNDSKSLIRPLQKIRIYWPETLAQYFKEMFLNRLNDIDSKFKHQNAIQGLCVLLPTKHLAEIINKYKPEEAKIKWAETDNVSLSIQKCLAKFIYLARPLLPVQLVLLFAKGDYLQFALPSIHSILYNISIDQSLQHIPTLLDAPASLQKHGLNFAFSKLKPRELIKACLKIWNTNRNASIRASIFKLVFDLLCKEQDTTNIKEIWSLLRDLIHDLTFDENKNIYATLSKVYKVPLTVKPDFCVVSYRYLKSLPPRTHCNDIISSVVNGTLDIMEKLDVEFVSELVFDSFNKISSEQYFYQQIDLISASLLSTKSVDIQTERYERIFVPLLQNYLYLLNNTQGSQQILKYNFKEILGSILNGVLSVVLEKGMIIPVKLFNDICLSLEKNFTKEEYYVRILTWKLAAEYMKLIDTYRPKIDNVQSTGDLNNDLHKFNKGLFLKAAPGFGKVCAKLFKNDTINYYPSIYKLFSKGITEIFIKLNINSAAQLEIAKSIIEHADTVEGHLLVLKIIPKRIYDSKEDIEERSVIYKKIASHTSPEVRMTYYQILRKYETVEDY